MPLVKGKHYPYTAAGKKAAAQARMKKGGAVRKKYAKGGAVRRSDPEKRKSVRKRAAEAALTPLARAGRRGVRGPNQARMINMLERRVSPRTTAVHEYAKGYAEGGEVVTVRGKRGPDVPKPKWQGKYAYYTKQADKVQRARDLNRTTRGPNS